MKKLTIIALAAAFGAAFIADGCKDSKNNDAKTEGDADVEESLEQTPEEETEQTLDFTETEPDAAEEAEPENDFALDGDLDEEEGEAECPELESCCVSYCDGNTAANCVGKTGADGCGYQEWKTQDCGADKHCEMDGRDQTAACVPNGGDEEAGEEPETFEDEIETQSSPSLKGHENSQCLNSEKKNSAGEEERFEASYDPQSKTLTAAHYNAVFNCCIEKIDVELKTDGFVLSLYEKEIAETPCNCICPYNVVSTIDGLADGEYEVKFYANGSYRGGAKVKVGSEAAAKKTTFSGCLNGTREFSDAETEETLSAKSAGGYVAVAHNGARYNCCKETIETDVLVYGYTIDLFEREITPDPCRCECAYNVETVIGPLAPGVYTINLYKLGKLELSTAADVAIPRMIREIYCR